LFAAHPVTTVTQVATVATATADQRGALSVGRTAPLLAACPVTTIVVVAAAVTTAADQIVRAASAFPVDAGFAGARVALIVSAALDRRVVADTGDLSRAASEPLRITAVPGFTQVRLLVTDAANALWGVGERRAISVAAA
jgi:hypothetical protein